MDAISNIGGASAQERSKLSSSLGGSADEISDRFLRLLIAQLKNQDPLKPMDNAEITSQMAQLNTVTGIQQLNDTMGGLVDSFGQAELLRATSLVGSSVTVEGNRFYASEEGGVVSYNMGRASEDTVITIRDEQGNVVYESGLGSRQSGDHVFQWDGTKSDGTKAGEGLYSFEVQGVSGGEPFAATTFEQRKVLGVSQNANGSIDLNIGGGERVGIEDVVEFAA